MIMTMIWRWPRNTKVRNQLLIRYLLILILIENAYLHQMIAMILILEMIPLLKVKPASFLQNETSIINLVNLKINRPKIINH